MLITRTISKYAYRVIITNTFTTLHIDLCHSTTHSKPRGLGSHSGNKMTASVPTLIPIQCSKMCENTRDVKTPS